MWTKLAFSLVLLALAALGTQLSGANFTASKSNPGNGFTAAADFCSGGTQTVPASRDSYVSAALGAGNTNFGNATTLEVQTATLILATSVRRTFVGFNLPAIPAFCDLTGATLRLFSTAAAGGRTIEVQRASASWTELGVTWNNAPGVTGALATSSSGTGWRSWNVTSLVQSQYSGTNNGFRVSDQGGLLSLAQGQTYQSTQGTPNTQDPELELTFG